MADPQTAPPAPATLVQLAAVVWNFALVGRSRCLSEAWSAAGQPNLFVQFPSPRNALERLKQLARPASPPHVIRPPLILPPRYWRPDRRAAIERRLRRVARDLRRQLDPHVNWPRTAALVVSPLWTGCLAELPFGRVVYDCIDDVSIHAPHPALADLYRVWEGELLARADGVVVTAELLYDDVRRRRPDVPLTLIRNGVDPQRFASLAAGPRPADLPASGRPLIGFVGALYEWIDWPLIEAAVAALPQCDFAFVGPARRTPALTRLAARPNVRFLGPRPYEQVPVCIQAFDVCWVPFDAGRVSRAANPVKVYEYLALGKPVVTTPVAGHASFVPHAAVGESAGEVIALLKAAVVECAAAAAPAAAEARRAFARDNSWARRAAEYAGFVAGL